MQHINKFISVCVAVGLVCNFASAQTKTNNAVTTAVPFLRIPPDARSAAMGAAGIATPADLNGVYYNPGKLAFLEKTTLSATYTPWLREWNANMYLAAIAGSFRVNTEAAVYGQVRYFSPGRLDFYDDNGNFIRNYRPNELAIDLGYSRKLSNRAGVGLALRYIQSDMGNGSEGGSDISKGTSVAADFGFYWHMNNSMEKGWTVGASLTNLGAKIGYRKDELDKSYIPANLGIGVSNTLLLAPDHKLVLALDINKLLVPTPPVSGDSAAIVKYRSRSLVNSWLASLSDAPGGFGEELQEMQFSFGADYNYKNQLSLRAGYFYENKYKGDRSYFSAGVGLKYQAFSFDFSYLVPASSGVTRSPLGNSLRLGCTFEMN